MEVSEDFLIGGVPTNVKHRPFGFLRDKLNLQIIPHNNPYLAPIKGQVIGNYIVLVNLPAVLVFPPRELADGGGGDLVSSLVVEDEITAVENYQAAVPPFPIIETFTTEFNRSHGIRLFQGEYRTPNRLHR